MIAVSKMKGLLKPKKGKERRNTATVAPEGGIGATREELGLSVAWLQLLRLHAQDLVASRCWKLCVMLVIVSNTVMLGVLSPDSNKDHHVVADAVYLILFGIEFLTVSFAWGFLRPICEEQIILRCKQKDLAWNKAIHQKDILYTDVVDEMRENNTRLACAEEHLLLHRPEGADSERLIHQPYLCENRNVLDFVVLVLLAANVTYYSVSAADGAAADALRSTRVLRTLRVIGAFKAMKLFQGTQQVMEPLQAMIPETLPTAGIVLVFTFLMSILGVKLFRDQLGQCTDTSMNSEDSCRGVYINDMYIHTPCNWANPTYFHFDRLDSGFLALCQIISLECWNDFMYTTMDRTVWAACLFYVFFVLISGLIFMQLFQGVVTTKFNDHTTTGALTFRQKVWEDTKDFIMKNHTAEMVEHHIEQHKKLLDLNKKSVDGLSVSDELPSLLMQTWSCLNRCFASDVFSVSTVAVHFCFFASYHYAQASSWSLTLYVIDLLVIYCFSSW